MTTAYEWFYFVTALICFGKAIEAFFSPRLSYPKNIHFTISWLGVTIWAASNAYDLGKTLADIGFFVAMLGQLINLAT